MRLLPAALCLSLLGACTASTPKTPGPGDPKPEDTGTVPSTTTTPVVPPPTLTAICTLDEVNALRARCTVEIDPPGPVQVAFQNADGLGGTRTHVSEESLTSHEVGLYFMTAESEIGWTASPVSFPEVSVSGTVVTGAVPADATLAVLSSGVSTADAFLMLSPCGGGMPMVVDTSGAVLWYEEISERKIESLVLTEDDTLMIEGGVEVFHFTWMGEELYRVVPGPETLHHDLFRKDGLNYALFKERLPLHGREYDLDGFYIFDDTGAVLYDWHLIDHIVPPDDPDLGDGNVVIDYSHSNGLFVDDDGDVFLSIRHLSTVLKINGDLADPDLGEVIWTLVGDPDEADVISDFTLSSSSGFSADFRRQHNAHLLSDGRLALFDNRVGETARASILTLDPAAGVANIDQTWDTQYSCSFQGSIWATQTGNPVAHCAPSRAAQEFDLGGGASPTYSLTLSCQGGLSTYIPRAIPLSLY